MARKPRSVAAASDASPLPSAEGFAATIEAFKTDHPELWEQIRLGPCQHGVEQIAKALRG